MSVEVSKHSSDAKLRFSESIVVEFLEASSEEENWEVMGPEISITFGPGPRLHSEECEKRWERAMYLLAVEGTK